MEVVTEVKTAAAKVVKAKRMYTSIEMSLLLFALQQRYMTLAQVKRKFFPEEREKDGLKAFNIVKRLLEESLIKTKDEKLGPDTLFLVTEAGRDLVVKLNDGVKLPERQKNIFQPVVKHDLLLTDLRIRFEQLNYVNRWGSENTLKEVPLFLREFQDLPDALVRKMDGRCYFLELEVSAKGPKQYRERIENYLRVLAIPEIQEQKVDGVIFFCVNDEVVDKIKSQIPKGAKGISVMPYEKYFRDSVKIRLVKPAPPLARVAGN